VDTYDDLSRLYDIAFGWDVTDEIEWLCDRFGPGTESVLEPACGAGRLLEGFVRRGIAVTGIDRSRPMLALARERLTRAGTGFELVEGDITDFDLGRSFSASVCPINTFGHLLTEEDAASHLECVGRHLDVGSRYLVQLGLRSLERFELLRPGPNTRWDTDHPDGSVRCTVFGKSFDPGRRVEVEITRFEMLSGPRHGEVFEGEGSFRVWNWPSWCELVDASPFRQVAAYDGNRKGRPACELGTGLEGRTLAWHELVRE
jgi:SAM-dependent methyltransferase